MNTGDMIRFWRPGYVHYAIFMEPVAENGVQENSVIHWWKDIDMPEPSVLITPFQRLAGNMMHETVKIEDWEGIDFTPVVPRARAFKERLEALRMDGTNFNGLFDDSYHFVDWCRNRLRSIDITEQNIMNMRDPRRFVHGSVTNTASRPDTLKMLSNLHPGDIIRFFHRDYEHWALCLENQRGVPIGVYWWDMDSVKPPEIAIGQFNKIMGYCKAEIVKYKGMNVNGEHDAFKKQMCADIMAQFPNIAGLFCNSKPFVFWYCYGIGLDKLPELQAMDTEEHVNNFITALMQTIRRTHNSQIQQALKTGDLIRFSQGSQEYFGLYIGKEQDDARVMWWMENGRPSIMVDKFETLAVDWKADIYWTADNDDDPNYLTGPIDINEMVNRANDLRKKVNKSEDDCSGLFSNSKHFVKWILYKYGPKETMKTKEPIATVTDIWQYIYDFKKSNKSLTDKAEIRWKNKMVLDTVKEGDLVKFHRTILSYPYDHYAVYIANSKDTGAASVIHWSNGDESYWLKHFRGAVTGAKASLRTDSFWTVAGYEVAANGNDIELEVSYIDGHEVVEKAKAKENKFNHQEERERKKYHLLIRNCEHFATKCRYGKKTSKQVQRRFGFLGII